MPHLVFNLMMSCTVSLAACALAAQRAMSQEVGDARHGYAFAATHCAECHAIDPNNPNSPNPKAPSFTSVAQTSGMSGRALAVWLDSSHPTMPNFVLPRESRDDVVAYIMSLKDVPPPR